MNKTYAYVYQDIIWEIIFPRLDDEGLDIPIERRYTESFVDSCIDITNTLPTPQQGWNALKINDMWVFNQPDSVN